MRSFLDLKHNRVKMKPETLDDLILLVDIITPGSLAKARTIRSVEIRRGEQKIKAGKRSFVVKILVEKVELNEASSQLRLGGKIVEAPEELEHGYHTLEIEPQTELVVEREWKAWEIERLRRAEHKPEKILICILDETEADIWIMEARKKHLRHLTCTLGKKTGESTKPKYYADIIETLKRDAKHIVIAGPAFAKEELYKIVKEKERELAQKTIVEVLAQTGDVGFQELLRRGILEKITKISKISEETKLVEELLLEISKEGNATYGKEQVRSAVESGAVTTLLVSDKKARELEDILEKAAKMKSKVVVISSDHESGKKLFLLGGIAALLRYKLS